MDTFNKRSTHIIECVVASNKVVSARKAHVEIPKVARFRMREGRKGERLARAWRPEDPQLCHEVHACWSIFIFPYTRASPLQFSQSPDLLGPCLRLPHSSALSSLRWVRSISLHASSAWNLQGSRQSNDIRSGRRRRLLMKGGTSTEIHRAASIPQQFLAN